MRLSRNFWLYEFERSQYATRHGINNTAPTRVVPALARLCVHVGQPARDHFARPVDISSGYRSPELNPRVGGSRDSQHMARNDEAAFDIEIIGVPNIVLAQWIWDNCDFDQLILEYPEPHKPNAGWVHVSYATEARNRREVLTKFRGIPAVSGLTTKRPT